MTQKKIDFLKKVFNINYIIAVAFTSEEIKGTVTRVPYSYHKLCLYCCKDNNKNKCIICDNLFEKEIDLLLNETNVEEDINQWLLQQQTGTKP